MFWITSTLLAVVVLAPGTIGANVDCSKPHPKELIHQCCSNPVFTPEIGAKCTPAGADANPALKMCFGECVFNMTGLAVEGSDKFKAALAEKFKSAPEFIPVMEQAMMKCEKSVKEKMANAPPPPGPKMDCNPLNTMIATCTLVETFVNCPESKWQKNDACNNAKEHMKSCPMHPKPAQ